MLAVIGDTHGERDHRLTGRTLRAVREADHVCHTGDFTTEAVYEAVASEVGADADESAAEAGGTGEGPALTAVHGNSDDPALRQRLPETATVDVGAFRLVLAHGHRHDETGLGLLARSRDADLIVVGHTHTPGTKETPGGLVVNPGSYADPRGARPAHAEIRIRGQECAVSLCGPDGTLLSTRTVSKERADGQ